MESSLGTRVAFYSRRDGNSEVYVMNADGSGQTRLTTDPQNDVGPRWSPDDSRIVFQTARVGGFPNWQLFMMNADGSNQHNVSVAGGRDSSPDWSIDNRLVFTSFRNGALKPNIFTVNIDGSHLQPLLTDAPLPQ